MTVKEAAKLYSVQIFAALAVIPLAWEQLPPDVKSWIPEAWQPYIIAAVAVGGIVARLVPQGTK